MQTARQKEGGLKLCHSTCLIYYTFASMKENSWNETRVSNVNIMNIIMWCHMKLREKPIIIWASIFRYSAPGINLKGFYLALICDGHWWWSFIIERLP